MLRLSLGTRLLSAGSLNFQSISFGTLVTGYSCTSSITRPLHLHFSQLFLARVVHRSRSTFAMLSHLRKSSARALVKETTRAPVVSCSAVPRATQQTARSFSTSTGLLDGASQLSRSTPLTSGNARGSPLVPTELLQVLEETIKVRESS